MSTPATPATPTAPATPQLCFGKVLHSRLRPVANDFGYGVYYLRLPLRTLGGDDFGPRLFSRNRFNLLSFHDSDHGDGKQALLPWIDQLLQAEGIDDATGEVWLQAFPRVLGYVFNPVSFWFCHRPDGALRAILCEVRNTFGEKHCYLLDTGAAMPYGIELTARKVFHVSPFCATEGAYRFRFMRTARKTEHTVARIDHDDASGPLLLTSISGVAAPLTDRTVLRAFSGYPLMTFGVVARIHWQALKLFIKRVPFFSKPVPPSQELTR
ncbi:DUF1365 domain-containing protein [Actimicrobium antarcticum]|uniref:DUF1365 domain-containing protein n=1 Tax=Actimicrobium antarcticum TaxID=1051899 RepID=A0ABP7T9E1_9BURK